MKLILLITLFIFLIILLLINNSEFGGSDLPTSWYVAAFIPKTTSLTFLRIPYNISGATSNHFYYKYPLLYLIEIPPINSTIPQSARLNSNYGGNIYVPLTLENAIIPNGWIIPSTISINDIQNKYSNVPPKALANNGSTGITVNGIYYPPNLINLMNLYSNNNISLEPVFSGASATNFLNNDDTTLIPNSKVAWFINNTNNKEGYFKI